MKVLFPLSPVPAGQGAQGRGQGHGSGKHEAPDPAIAGWLRDTPSALVPRPPRRHPHVSPLSPWSHPCHIPLPCQRLPCGLQSMDTKHSPQFFWGSSSSPPTPDGLETSVGLTRPHPCKGPAPTFPLEPSKLAPPPAHTLFPDAAHMPHLAPIASLTRGSLPKARS